MNDYTVKIFFDCLACLIMPFRGLKKRRKRTAFSAFFLENAMNSLSEHASLSEFISIHWIYAFSEELAKRAYRTKRVHLLRMNTRPVAEIPVVSKADSLSPGNLVKFFVESHAKLSVPELSAFHCGNHWAKWASLAKLPYLVYFLNCMVPLSANLEELSTNPCDNS